MKKLLFICLLIPALAYSFTYKNNAQTGKPDMVTTSIADITDAPTKITGATLDALSNDIGFVTAKSISDGHKIPHESPGTSGNLLRSDGTNWKSVAPPIWNQNTTGNAGTASQIFNSAGALQTINFAAAGGQPTWLWGTNDGLIWNVWNTPTLIAGGLIGTPNIITGTLAVNSGTNVVYRYTGATNTGVLTINSAMCATGYSTTSLKLD